MSGKLRKMRRSDVREWIPGEPLERVDFGNGCTGMNKSIPKEPGNAGDFKRLIWKCRAIEADGGPCLDVLPSEYWIDDVKQAGYFDVVTCASSFGPLRFDDAWTYLNGIEKGWHLAQCERHSSPIRHFASFSIMKTFLRRTRNEHQYSGRRFEKAIGLSAMRRYSGNPCVENSLFV